MLQRVDLLAHRAGIAHDPPRPVQRPLAFGRKSLEAGPALDQHHAEDLLELLEPGRHGRLGDAAGLCRPSKMPLLGQRQQQFKLVDQPFVPSDPVVAYKLSRRACTNTQKPATDTSFISDFVSTDCAFKSI